MNDTTLVSKLYGVKLPQNIIDELEGTDDKLYFEEVWEQVEFRKKHKINL